jgi:hypothetical protein
VHLPLRAETIEWRHIALPIDEDIWRCLGLELWQLRRLREFQDFLGPVFGSRKRDYSRLSGLLIFDFILTFWYQTIILTSVH